MKIKITEDNQLIQNSKDYDQQKFYFTGILLPPCKVVKIIMLFFFLLLSSSRKNIYKKYRDELDADDDYDDDEYNYTDEIEDTGNPIINYGGIIMTVFYIVQFKADKKIELSDIVDSLDLMLPQSQVPKAYQTLCDLFSIEYYDFRFYDIFLLFNYTNAISKINKFTDTIYSKYTLLKIFKDDWNNICKVINLCNDDILSLTKVFKINRDNLQELLREIRQENEKVTLADAFKGFDIDPVYIFSIFDTIHEFIHDQETTADEFLTNRFNETVRSSFEEFFFGFQYCIYEDEITYDQFKTYINDLRIVFHDFKNYLGGLLAKFSQELGQTYLKLIMEKDLEISLKNVSTILNSMCKKCEAANIKADYLTKASSFVNDLISESFVFNIGEIVNIDWLGDFISDTIKEIANDSSIWDFLRTVNKYNQITEIREYLQNAFNSLEQLATFIINDETIDNLLIPSMGAIRKMDYNQSIQGLNQLYQWLVLGNLDYDPNVSPDSDLFYEILVLYITSDEDIEDIVYFPEYVNKTATVEKVYNGSYPLKQIKPFINMSEYDKSDNILQFRTLRYLIKDIASSLGKYQINQTKILDLYDELVKPLVDTYTQMNNSINTLLNSETTMNDLYENRYGKPLPAGKYKPDDFKLRDLYDLFNCSKWIEHSALRNQNHVDAYYNFWHPEKPHDFSTDRYEHDYHISSKRISEISEMLHNNLTARAYTINNYSVQKAISEHAKIDSKQVFIDANEMLSNINLSSTNLSTMSSLLYFIGDVFGLHEVEIANTARITTSEWMTIFGIILAIFVILFSLSIFIRKFCLKSKHLEETSMNLEDINDESHEKLTSSLSVLIN